jgi:chromosome segregation ATPase
MATRQLRARDEELRKEIQDISALNFKVRQELETLKADRPEGAGDTDRFRAREDELQGQIRDLKAQLEQSSLEKIKVQEEVEAFRARLEEAGKDASVREVKLKSDAESLEQDGRTYVREWTGFYQVIVKSFLDVPVRVRGHAYFANMLERHEFDITVDPEEEYPQVERTVPGSPPEP